MPKKSVIPIEFAGRSRGLCFDFNSLCALEEQYGMSLTDLQKIFPDPDDKEARGKMMLSNLRILVWAALLHEDENITPIDVGKLIEPQRMVEITEKVAEALVAAFPDVDEGEVKNEKGSTPEKK